MVEAADYYLKEVKDSDKNFSRIYGFNKHILHNAKYCSHQAIITEEDLGFLIYYAKKFSDIVRELNVESRTEIDRFIKYIKSQISA